MTNLRPAAELSATDARRELDAIVASFEDGEMDLDLVVAQLTRATELAQELDRRIKATRLQVESLAPALLAIATDPETGEILA
jgi:exodeoxyribonuclease VII small subunit